VHGLLEHAMRHRDATREDLRRLAMWLTVEQPRMRGVIEAALDTVAAVSRAEFWSTARGSAECHEEAPFSVREDPDGVPTVVSGTIDLVYRSGDDGWRILDYKTDADATAAELRERYAGQLGAYRRAWGRVSGERAGAEVVSARISGTGTRE
jgi:ATP-dependent exoDNAse (exonuclease V) beta subunit